MALCFVHGAAGYVGYEAVRPADRHRPGLLVAALLLANGADFDFLPGILIGHPAAFHRGITHTMAGAVIVGLVVTLARPGWFRGSGAALRAGLWATAIYASHLVIDYFSSDARPPFGAQFLWPLSDAFYLSPVTPLREILVDMSATGAFFRSLFQPATLATWSEEISIFVGTVVVVQLYRAWRRADAGLETESVVGVVDQS